MDIHKNHKVLKKDYKRLTPLLEEAVTHYKLKECRRLKMPLKHLGYSLKAVDLFDLASEIATCPDEYRKLIEEMGL
jgi:hypothetical protein